MVDNQYPGQFKDLELIDQLRLLESGHWSSLFSVLDGSFTFAFSNPAPVFKAVDSNDMDFLLKYFSDPATDPNDITTGKEEVNLITYACCTGHVTAGRNDLTEWRESRVAIIRFLIDKGANVNARCNVTGMISRGLTSFAPIHVAIGEKNEPVVHLLLENKVDPCIEANPYKLTPLHLAAYKDLPGICEVLLRSGADINQQDVDGNTALILSCAVGNPSVSYVLLKWSDSTGKKVDVNARNSRNITALHAAVFAGSAETVELLLLFGARVNSKTVEGHTPLDIALFMGNIKIRKLLAERGENSTLSKRKDKVPKLINEYLIPGYGCTSPLINSAMFSYLDDIKYFVERGDDLNVKDAHGQTPLFHAVLGGSVKAVNFLVMAQVEINVESIQGYTALHFAVFLGFEQISSVLLQNGAKIDNSLLVSAAELPPLPNRSSIGSIKKKKAKIAQKLILRGCPFDQKYSGLSPVEYAVRAGNDPVALVINRQMQLFQAIEKLNLSELRKCLTSGAIASCQSVQFGTPLLHAVVRNNLDIVSSLIEHGANVNFTPPGKDTALHYAAKNNFHTIVRKLLACGAAFDVLSTSSSKTPLEMCLENNPDNCETAVLLKFVQSLFGLSCAKDLVTLNDVRNLVVKTRDSSGKSVDDIYRASRPGRRPHKN